MADIETRVRKLDGLYEDAFFRQPFAQECNGQINFSGSFFGTSWGILESNRHCQWWRWLGPFGYSNLYLAVKPDCDYLLTTHVHTAISGEVLDSLRLEANGKSVAKQGISWEGPRCSHWAQVPKSALLAREGKIKLTYRLTNVNGQSRTQGVTQAIAFSHAFCKPLSRQTTEQVNANVGIDSPAWSSASGSSPGETAAYPRSARSTNSLLVVFISRSLSRWPIVHDFAKQTYRAWLRT